MRENKGTLRKAAPLGGVLLLLAGCGSDEPMEPADAQACETYGQSVESAEAGSEQEMMDGLDAAWQQAESDRLQDLIDDLMIGMEEEYQVDQEAVNGIRSWCGIG